MFDDVAIEVIQGEVALHTTGNSGDFGISENTLATREIDAYLGYNFEDAFVAKPVPGTGIGAAGGGTATHGGYLEVRLHSDIPGVQDETMTVALSCHHTYSSTSSRAVPHPSSLSKKPSV